MQKVSMEERGAMMSTAYGASGSFSAGGPFKLRTKPFIISIARNAVAHNKELEPSDVDFKVIAGGNVIVVGSESYDQTPHRTSFPGYEKESKIIVPRQEAFDLIASGLSKKAQQLEIEYKQKCLIAKRWSRISLVAAFSTIVTTIVTSVIIINYIYNATNVFIALLLMLITIFGIIILFFSFRRARLSSKRINECDDILLEIDKLCMIMKHVPTLKINDESKQLLEEIIIAETLTLSSN